MGSIQNLFGLESETCMGTQTGDMADIGYPEAKFTVFSNKSKYPNILYVHLIVHPGGDEQFVRDFIRKFQDRMNKRKHSVHLRIYEKGNVSFWSNFWRG